MKNIIKNRISLFIAIIGLLGGLIWAYTSSWDFEPIILSLISLVEIIGFILIKENGSAPQEKIRSDNSQNNTQNVNVNLHIPNNNQIQENKKQQPNLSERNAKIEAKKPRISILFIDDDKKFNVVKILKESGWKNTKTVVDVKNIDVPNIQNADIIFVDINGVGKLLSLEHEGLDLALMIKQKYSKKKVVIYSANKYSNSFHKAWDIIDSRLEKNALPYQFQNLVENYSLEFYN